MDYRFGYRNIKFPSEELGFLPDSSSLLGDTAALEQRMQEDGFLLLRGLIERQKVLKARNGPAVYG